MYELIQAAPNSYYIQCPAKIGLVRLSDTEVCLIDSGNNRDAGKKVLRVLQEKGWTLRCILNTHSHADHIGGNAYLQKQTGCAVYTPGIETDFTNHPVLESCFIYGGFSPKGLRSKFLMAQASNAMPMTEEMLPDGITLIPLPGHAFDMVGFRTADDAVYLADCLSSKETLDKYGITFLTDVQAYLDTLEAVKGMQAKVFIPAHAAPCEDIAPLAQYNIDKVHEIAGAILDFCREPVNFEALLQKLFRQFGMTMTLEQYALVGSTVRSYLAWLLDGGKLSCCCENEMLLFHTNA